MILPSKELLSEVLGVDVKSVEKWEENSIRYFSPKDYIINIYELMHVMKEWAISEGYSISTWYEISLPYTDKDNKKRLIECWWECDSSFTGSHGKEDTEPEAVTLACEWLLKEM